MADTVAGPPHVLVAEPHADTRALYAECWRLEGWTVTEAENGAGALAQSLHAPPSLIVAELRLPGLDGFALCESLRRDAATARIPM